MARTYDATRGPGVLASKSAGLNQAKRPGSKVLVNSGQPGEVTNRDKISLIHVPLWSDASYTNGGAIWLGGGVAQPLTVGGAQVYN